MSVSTTQELECPDCGSVMELRENRRGGFFYGCIEYPSCAGTRPAYSDGTPVLDPNPTTLRARAMAALALQRLWRSGAMTRKAAHRWMRTVMRLPAERCYVARFTERECEQFVELVERELRI